MATRIGIKYEDFIVGKAQEHKQKAKLNQGNLSIHDSLEQCTFSPKINGN